MYYNLLHKSLLLLELKGSPLIETTSTSSRKVDKVPVVAATNVKVKRSVLAADVLLVGATRMVSIHLTTISTGSDKVPVA